jgi:glycosidase
MFLIDTLHQNDIGVILDWVPSHFPADAHGLAYFDGTHVFEHADPRQGVQPEWNSYVFNYGRHEVRGFLISNALFWLDRYHADGLRVDAVASMLYLDYARSSGEWVPNRHGGRENLEAIDFLKQFNQAVYQKLSRTCRRSPKSPPLGHWFHGRFTAADLASVSNGTWVGCTTRWTIFPKTQSIASISTTDSRSEWSMLFTRTSCCRFPTTRWFTANGRS